MRTARSVMSGAENGAEPTPNCSNSSDTAWAGSTCAGVGASVPHPAPLAFALLPDLGLAPSRTFSGSASGVIRHEEGGRHNEAVRTFCARA